MSACDDRPNMSDRDFTVTVEMESGGLEYRNEPTAARRADYRGAMVTPALRVRNVTKRFAELVAVESISFDIKPHEFVSVIGPSGCGKSTLFNIIGGFVTGYEGEILIHGAANNTRRSIGMVFQEESTFPWRTTLENVAFPL